MLFCLSLIILCTHLESHEILEKIYQWDISKARILFEKEITIIGGGDLTTEIRLRKKDQVTDMATCLNRMTGELRNKIFSIKTDVESLIAMASEKDTSRELIDGLEDLNKKIDSNFQI